MDLIGVQVVSFVFYKFNNKVLHTVAQEMPDKEFCLMPKFEEDYFKNLNYSNYLERYERYVKTAEENLLLF